MERSENEFIIIVVYIDDINIVGTLNELTKENNYLKKEFEMKDLRRQCFVWDYKLNI